MQFISTVTSRSMRAWHGPATAYQYMSVTLLIEVIAGNGG